MTREGHVGPLVTSNSWHGSRPRKPRAMMSTYAGLEHTSVGSSQRACTAPRQGLGQAAAGSARE